MGTVDQALTSILHQNTKRLDYAVYFVNFTVDEVHANDSYASLLKVLLEFQGASGGSVVMMSATLPEKIKKELIESFQKGISKETPEIKFDQAYPLITHTTGISTSQTSIEAPDQLKKKFKVQWLHELEDVIDFLVENASRGESSCWIRNTVQEARIGFVELKKELMKRGLDASRIDLFHARFMMGDRLKIETNTLERFGKTSDSKTRKGRIPVATQVVEQSLDLDFDQMVTDLAPLI